MRKRSSMRGKKRETAGVCRPVLELSIVVVIGLHVIGRWGRRLLEVVNLAVREVVSFRHRRKALLRCPEHLLRESRAPGGGTARLAVVDDTTS